MAQFDPTWSLGESKLIQSSGDTVDADDDVWSYGENILRHEQSVVAGTTNLVPRTKIIQTINNKFTLFGGV